MYKIRGFDYEVVYDNDRRITVPALCTEKNAKIINNINISGLQKLIDSNDGLWSEESKNDFRDLLEYEPSDKINYAMGEIILAPYGKPDSYYKINQTATGDKVYLFVEKLARIGGKTEKKKRVKKSKNDVEVKETKETKQTKISEGVEPEIVEQPIKQKRAQKKETVEVNISLECFLMLRIAEALNDYARIVFPDEVKEYKRVNKK